jgi:multimeric flavodoxin WrbA
MPKKIIILKSSPRKNGNSSILADQLAEGAKETGAQVEAFILHEMDIRPCDGCDSCHETDGVCVIKDDMQKLYPKLQQADAIVVASPVYWFTVNAQAKLCIDRWYAFEVRGGNRLKGKKFGLILTYGDTDLYNSGGINAIHTFESMLRYLRAEFTGVVHASAGDAGDILKNPEVMQKANQLGQRLALN